VSMDADAGQQGTQELAERLREMEGRIESLETAVAELREEIDETRRDDRRVAELYDLVFERLKIPQAASTAD
jgi:uncharacterized coiled-coil protein SlyX